jgi:2-polyprenyl-3-methyl-5-hydroxy-6-metoxy-1,4-benzoquinol methylase
MNDFVQIPCPLCKSSQSRALYSTRDYNRGYPGAFTYVECAGCGLVYENPRPRPDKLRACYPAYYGTQATPDVIAAKNKTNVPVHSFRAKLIEKHCARGTLLDIGCGSGYFIEYMRRRGWRVRGIDPAPELVDYARERLGLTDVQTAAWPMAGGSPAQADVVTMLHVLEHLEAPVEALLASRDALFPAGLLVIETPNIRSWPARIFGKRIVSLDAPRHLMLFSSKTLQQAVELAGFQILELKLFSPSTIEYSESIRYFLNDIGIRRYPKYYPWVAAENKQATADHNKRGIPVALLHGCEGLLYRGLNRAANACGAGNNLCLVARKM